MARPTKLTTDLRKKAEQYIAECEDTINFTNKGAISYIDVKLPSIVGLAKYLGIHKDTVYEWRKTDTMFSDLVKDVEQEQEIRLVNKGLGGLYTSKALNAMLSKHGYNEKTETDITTKGESLNVNTEALERAEKAYLQTLDGTTGTTEGT